ncbi:predicted protein [Nematostella vectensis]|uniref:Uncharacterized protein n=2 Tax=Nematostella vectensis TaxID=45351 RepID=A7SI35_NEMVE|nr:predicted protein [Nematostella vectensis]|eukprot:XP_001628683.1 predicted protein [Nematostella vectensis]
MARGKTAQVVTFQSRRIPRRPFFLALYSTMNSIPVLLVLLGALTETVLSVPARNDDIVYTTIDCPPGIWVCKKRRSEIAQPVRREPRVDCPPGVWTCQKKREEIAQQAEAASGQTGESDDINLCPPGIWVCDRKRELKRLREQRAKAVPNKPAKRINMCPPGIWVCD